jgi:hypothetical protein
MTTRLLGALDRGPAWARRSLMIAVPLVLLGVLVAGFALAPSGGGDRSEIAGAAARVLPPSPTIAPEAHARPAQPALTIGQGSPAAVAGQRGRSRTRPRAARPPPVRGPVSEQPPPASPRAGEGMMLAVARSFSAAYMPYQVGRLPRWARTAIERTCTLAFARYLLAQPAQVTPLQGAHPDDVETYRVASVEPAGAPNTVVVSYVSQQARADTGEFLLRLVREHGHWLVADLEA